MLGIHNSGSFGSRRVSLLGLSSLGMIADINEAGWFSSAEPYAGDYTMFFSMEGSVIQYTEGSTLTNIAMYGQQGYEDMSPSLFEVTSSAGRPSALWAGTKGPLSMRTVTSFEDEGFIVRTSVTIKNVGARSLEDVYCEWCTLVGIRVVKWCA